MYTPSMNAHERKSALALAGVFSTRMLGLFMILPVFAIYAEQLQGVTPVLIGLAIGIYGLTQALLQIPFGMLSDRIGRKPVIIGGLMIFMLGSIVAALADSIYGVVAGRALQGAGAVAAAVMALLADNTREEHRTKAMAMVGMSIGMSFLLAMVLGPVLDGWVGVPGIFWITASLALAGMLIVAFLVPSPQAVKMHRDTGVETVRFSEVLGNPDLRRLDVGIFILHWVLTASFVVLPLSLRDMGLETNEHWQVYLPVMVAAMLSMVPFIIIGEKKHKLRSVFLGAIGMLFVSQLIWYRLHDSSILAFALLLWLFFTAFNLLEASLPSLVSKTAPAQSKGTAMGVYSTSQFLGAFLGGVCGGWVFGEFGMEGVFVMSAILLLVWFLYAMGMAEPRYVVTTMLNVGTMEQQAAQRMEEEISAIAGVSEVTIMVDEGVAYLKVDKRRVDYADLARYSVANA